MNRISDTHTVPLNDEIDLFVLFQSLWQQKILITVLVGIFTLVAAIYAFISKPIFEVKAYVLPPTINAIAEFNYGRTKAAQLIPFTVKDVYGIFLRNLQAESLLRGFYDEVYLPSLSDAQRQGSQDVLYAGFSRLVGIGLSSKDSPDRYAISFQGADPEKSAEWLKLFVARANTAALQEMISNVMSEAEVRARNLEQQITTLRQSGKGAREDSIARLREALIVAESIGLEKPPIISGNLSSQLSATMDGPLIYMRGVKALKAEIKNLGERASDDPFIPKLRTLEVQYSYFQSINVRPESVAVYRQDGPIDIPDSPIKPKKILIIGLGFLLGAMFGIMLALIRHFIKARRDGASTDGRAV